MMRDSAVYNKYTTPEGVEQLMSKYLYKMFLAEQDWLTNLGFFQPQLFHNLPCQFNRQTSIRKESKYWRIQRRLYYSNLDHFLFIRSRFTLKLIESGLSLYSQII